MRLIKTLGFALLLAGSLVVISSSGAFDSLDANRGVSVETAADENALLGVEKFGTESDPIMLNTYDGFFFTYFSVEIISFEDNIQGYYEIEVTEITLEDTGGHENSPSLIGWELTDENTVEADLQCDREWSWGSGFDQNRGQGVLTVTAVMGESEDVTVELDRSVPVECAGG